MITITQVDQGRKGYFLAQEDTNEAGRMTYNMGRYRKVYY